MRVCQNTIVAVRFLIDFYLAINTKFHRFKTYGTYNCLRIRGTVGARLLRRSIRRLAVPLSNNRFVFISSLFSERRCRAVSSARYLVFVVRYRQSGVGYRVSNKNGIRVAVSKRRAGGRMTAERTRGMV